MATESEYARRDSRLSAISSCCVTTVSTYNAPVIVNPSKGGGWMQARGGDLIACMSGRRRGGKSSSFEFQVSSFIITEKKQLTSLQ